MFTTRRALLSEVIQPRIAEFQGHIFKQTGDNVLADFDSVVEAARCAAVIRDDLARRNLGAPAESQILLRIGINLGDIISEGGDIFGDGVNVAARLESIAEPGNIVVSEIVHDQVAGRVDYQFDDLGPKSLKNIAKPVRVYRLRNAGEVPPKAGPLVTPIAFDSARAIAVLPFNNFSGDPEQEFFADGITEDIITMLAGWRAFPVIARNSTFVYKGKTVDIKQVGQELGVRYVLEGSVRKSGRRVRVTAQLIRADTGHHLMADKYDRDLTDLFELQDEVASAIAGAIEPELLKFERDRVAGQPQHNPDAYQLHQHGQWHHYRHTKEDNLLAQDYFRRALAIDPQYPQATAALSVALLNAAYLNWTDEPQRHYDESFDLAQRAITLDPRDPAARFAMAVVCMWTSRFDRSVAEMQEAINLNPSYAAAHCLLGHMYVYAGQAAAAIALVEKGLRLSPNDPRLFIWLPALAGAHYQLRHYEEAVSIGRRAWALNRNWPHGLRYVVAGLAQLDRIAEAQAPLDELRKLDKDLAFVEGILTRLYRDRAGVDHFLEGLRKVGFE